MEPSNNRRHASKLVEIGFSLVILIIIITLGLSIFQTIKGGETGFARFLKDPQTLTVAIGLIISILFVERWRSLETRLDSLLLEQRDSLNQLREAATAEIKSRVTPLVSKAENLNSNVIGLEHRHPWLEVITERDIIVETDGIRGILRTCEWLLKEGQLLHLYEYLEYCSRKGTDLDPRTKKTRLQGTADDFLELAYFCETWLGEYYLSSEFIARYLERFGSSSYALLPYYITKLLRNGNFVAADQYADRLRKIVVGGDLWTRLKLLIGLKKPAPKRFRWRAYNVLALTRGAIGDESEMNKFSARAKESVFAVEFGDEQELFDIELAIVQGDFRKAKLALDALRASDLAPHDLADVSYLYGKIGDYEMAADLRDVLMKNAHLNFGDDSRKFAHRQKGEPSTEGEASDDEVARARVPSHHQSAEPNIAPDLGKAPDLKKPAENHQPSAASQPVDSQKTPSSPDIGDEKRSR